MDIKIIAKSIKREDFLEEVSEENSRFECPSNDGLKDDCSHIGYSKEECKKCWEQAVKDIKFKDDVEDEKVEDKTIKVRCINNGNMEQEALTIGNEYDAKESVSITGAYEILIDDVGRMYMNFSKSWFEKVEDVLMVECIDNRRWGNDLKLNELYKVNREKGRFYYIGEGEQEQRYYKSRFKKVEPQKNREYTVMELLDFPVETKFYANLQPYATNTTVEVKEFKTEHGKIKAIICNSIDEENQKIEFTEIWAKGRYTKVEPPKPVTTSEAFKALEEGKTIESYDKTRYKIEDGYISSLSELQRNKGFKNYILVNYINREELQGKWLIIESEDK